MKTIVYVMIATLFFGQNAVTLSNEETNKEIYKEMSYKTKGNKLYYKGKYELALIFLEKAFVENPTDPKINFFLGNIYNHKKLFNKAINAFKRGIEISKTYEKKLPFMYNLARTYQAKRNYKEALAIYSTIEDNQSEYKDINLYKGMIQFKLKNKKETINEWQKYLLKNTFSPQYQSVSKAIYILQQENFKWKEIANSSKEEDKEIVEDLQSPKEKPLNEKEIKEAEEKLVEELKNREVEEAGKIVEKSASKVELEKEENVELESYLERKEGKNFEEIER